MGADDDSRPITTAVERDEPHEEMTTPQPWLRRFSSVVGFASTGTGMGGSQALS
jgi:hypothetical protein